MNAPRLSSFRRATALAGLLALGCSAPPDGVTDLDASLSPLHAWFEAHAGQPRALLLLSPL